ncbi:hypothetical protein HDU76_001343 [Blyttiomyces sp. JEL0837]|nr:hypothetical protein HDU76_001343 [Blyttiomyces sp. JEL0837]
MSAPNWNVCVEQKARALLKSLIDAPISNDDPSPIAAIHLERLGLVKLYYSERCHWNTFDEHVYLQTIIWLSELILHIKYLTPRGKHLRIAANIVATYQFQSRILAQLIVELLSQALEADNGQFIDSALPGAGGEHLVAREVRLCHEELALAEDKENPPTQTPNEILRVLDKLANQLLTVR